MQGTRGFGPRFSFPLPLETIPCRPFAWRNLPAPLYAEAFSSNQGKRGGSMTHQAHAARVARAIHRRPVRCALAAVLALFSSAAAAQGIVTIYGGARWGGEFHDQNAGGGEVRLASAAAVSLSYDWSLADGAQAQLFYSFQRSALPGSVLNRPGEVPVDISYLHIGGRVFVDSNPDTSGTYVVGGLGATIFSPHASGLSSEVRPSMNLGLGYQWVLSKQLALRTELRGYATFVNSSGGFMCSGGCVVSIRSDTVTQLEGMLGLSFGF
jgi:hypothetical protein